VIVKCPIPHEVNRNGDVVVQSSCTFCGGTGEVEQVEATCRQCNGKTIGLLGGGTAILPTGKQRVPLLAGRSHCCQSPISVNLDTPKADAFSDTPDEEAFPYTTDPCPKCGKKTVMAGYGLAGGGMGTYWGCDSCDYFHKEQDKDDD